MTNVWSLLPLLFGLSVPFAVGCDSLSEKERAKEETSDDGDDDDDDDDDERSEKKSKKSKKKKSKKSKKSDDDGSSFDDEDPFVAEHMKLLLEAANCDSKKKRMEHWCQVAEGFTKGKRGVPSKGVKVGTTTFVVTKDASKKTLDKFASLSCLAVRKSGKTYAQITSVKPDNAQEQRSVDKSRKHVIEVLEGERDDIRMTPDLKAYVDSLPDKAKYEAEKTDGGFRIDGGSNADVRRVGSTWIAVEIPRKNPAGIYVSIFTDAEYQ